MTFEEPKTRSLMLVGEDVRCWEEHEDPTALVADTLLGMGLPGSTGHGIGLEVHEATYMGRGNMTPMQPGLCFSVEPTICIYDEFGIRLEDCACMTVDGPKWFTPGDAVFAAAGCLVSNFP